MQHLCLHLRGHTAHINASGDAPFVEKVAAKKLKVGAEKAFQTFVIGLCHLLEHAIIAGNQHGRPPEAAPFALLDDACLWVTCFEKGGNDAGKALHHGLNAQFAHAF